MKKEIFILAAVAAACAAHAVSLDGLADIRFAESYAFSTNRAALIETLGHGTDAWHAYSILNAQTEGRLDEAKELNKRWSSDGKDVGKMRLAFAYRQNFLDWDRGKCQDFFIPQNLEFLHVWEGVPDREVELKPNAYPSELKDDEVSFGAFEKLKSYVSLSDFEDGFVSIALRDDAKPLDRFHYGELLRQERDYLPDTPGLMKYMLEYMTNSDKGDFFVNYGVFKKLTLQQLAEVARATKGTEKDVAASSVFADIVLAKLAQSADDDPDDPKVREDLLRRRLDFTKTLAPALKQKRIAAERELLEFYRRIGDLSHKELFIDYLKDIKPDRGLVDCGDKVVTSWNSQSGRREAEIRRGDELVMDYLAALAVDDTQAFSELVEKKFLAKTVAEAQLLAGKSGSDVNTRAFSDDEFKRIRDRVELNWAKSNTRTFAAKDRVSLALDVKNVQKMRVAIYELDAVAACRAANGEVASDIDLDCAVPTVERVLDFSDRPSVLRHRETLEFSELAEPGLYVVECSGGGVSSRAVVRKGRLRATERRDAAGHVFAALDEDGKTVKGAKVWLDGTVFTAGADGNVAVPFAADGKSAGRKIAVVGAGRLATAIVFDHAAEEYSLGLSVVLPPESLVAGREATALVRPTLRTGGVVSTLKLLENPVLTVTFTDLQGRSTVKTYKGFQLFDDAESVCRFNVPWNLSNVSFKLVGSVKRVTGVDDERLSAAWTMPANAIARGGQIEQLFLRRTAGGYVLECRGRTGEPLAYRAVTLSFKHRAYKSGWHDGNVRGGGIPPGRSIEKTLQFDMNGEIRLGSLVDIEEIRTKSFGGWKWKPGRETRALNAADDIAAAEGETISIPARGLLDGAWPGADSLEAWVSLLAVNHAGEITEDCIRACTLSNCVLRIAGLRAGDYRLKSRTESAAPIRISVAKAAKGVGEGGVIASAARSLSDTGDPEGARIDSAEVATNGVLRVRVANAGPDSRVHVFAARTLPQTGDATPFSALAAALDRPQLREGRWGAARTDYISGRDLGDKLRYILDRRQEPGRIGNMLERPSLLLNPWTTSETETKEQKHSEGEGWEGVESPTRMKSMSAVRCPVAIQGGAGRPVFACYDFMPEPAAVFANLRPGKDGVVEVDLRAGAAGMQDVSVVVTDGRTIDEARLAHASAPFSPRDLRVKGGFDALANSTRTKSYSTVGELYALMKSLSGGEGAFAEFGFLADWAEKGADEKRELYGKYASHELDFFIFEKDREFFDSVVAPHLRNKRLKDFMDKWLLKEDVSEYASPGRFQDLNALEQCLLARCDKALAQSLARSLADWCDANPVDPGEDDRRLSIALAEMEENVAASEDAVLECVAADAADADSSMPGSLGGMRTRGGMAAPRAKTAMLSQAHPGEMAEMSDFGWSNQRAVLSQGQAETLRRSRMNGIDMKKRREQEVASRNERQFWRPPERTKEWVESHWYRRRHGDDTLSLAKPSRFLRDYAAAIASGKDAEFRSVSIIDAAGTLADMVAALAVTRVGFEAKYGEAVVFSRAGEARHAGARNEDTVRIERHFFHADETNEDGSAKEALDEFVRGKVYFSETIAINATARLRRVRVVSQIPEGAIALYGCAAAADVTLVLGGYAAEALPKSYFYFPIAGEGVGKMPDVVALERGARVGAGGGFVCNVVAESSKRDTTSWRYVSQNATNDEVLEYLRTKNLANVDLAKIGWRFSDGNFARAALGILEERGAYCQALWLAGFKWRDAYDARRIKEALSRRENIRKLAPVFGPVFKSSLLEIEPEAADLFEHREYWPMINARAHAKGGAATIANEGLKKTYREFLDVLAAKKTLSANDRLLAAAYLIAQDRIAEAEAQVAAAESGGGAAAIETRMQLDYMKAYLAFSRGDAAAGRAIAEKWADAAATPLWRGRFREVVAQAKEILEGVRADAAHGDQAASAPSLAMKADAKDGVPEGVVVTARNLASCTLKAYPVDVEIGFSKDPFGTGGAASGGVLAMKPAWTEEVALKDGKEARVALPKALRRTNLVLVATGAEGRVEERIELMPGSLDVQAAKEYGQLRVRDASGRPVAGAYVKVYAKDQYGRQMKFHKDGYTDMRGAFDYAAVSTDSEFRPAEFAIFVESASDGVKTLCVKAPL